MAVVVRPLGLGALVVIVAAAAAPIAHADVTTDDLTIKADPPDYQPLIAGGLSIGVDPDGPSRLRQKLWLPFGLLDRMRLAPFHMSATTELTTQDATRDTAALTLHAQMSTECSCNIGIYATLPTVIDLSNDARTDATSQGLGAVRPPPTAPDSATRLGTMDVGLFGSSGRRQESWIYRIGGLLPTGSRDVQAWLPSGRVGDRVLELPRSAGARASVSKLYGWRNLPRMCDDLFAAFRIDAGVDVASVLALPGNPVHVIPRAGAGMMLSLDGNWTYSVDTALSADPFVDDRLNLRWSTGITARRARADGNGGSAIQPAFTVAGVRTPDGWSASLLVDLTATVPMRGSGYDD